MNSTHLKLYSIRIGLGLMLLAGLAGCTLNLLKIRSKIVRLDTKLKQEMKLRRDADERLARSAAAIQVLTFDLQTARQSYMEAAAKAQTESKRSLELGSALDVSENKRTQAEAYLARYKATEMEPEQVLSVSKALKELEAQLSTTQQEKAALENKIKLYTANNKSGDEIPLPRGMKSRILSYDPKWRFVVLDNGAEEGMVKNAQMLVARGGKLVGKIRISEVQKNNSIGNLVQEEQLGEVLEGDIAVPAYPGS